MPYQQVLQQLQTMAQSEQQNRQAARQLAQTAQQDARILNQLLQSAQQDVQVLQQLVQTAQQDASIAYQFEAREAQATQGIQQAYQAITSLQNTVYSQQQRSGVTTGQLGQTNYGQTNYGQTNLGQATFGQSGFGQDVGHTATPSLNELGGTNPNVNQGQFGYSAGQQQTFGQFPNRQGGGMVQ